MDVNKLLALLPNATLPTQLVVQMLAAIEQLPNSSKTFPLWAEVNRLLIEQAQAAESGDGR